MHDPAQSNSLTVIIPTYNRKDLLAKALAGYLQQTAAQLIHELIVIDDGSVDDTESMVLDISTKAPFVIRYLRQANKGPAAARNYGIREARSKLILFTDSDIIPGCDLVAQHLEWHRRYPELNAAVLGYVTWDPAVNPTPFMHWYSECRLFWYHRLRGKQEADSFHFFTTCNLSLKTEFLRTHGQFDEDFKTAAYEDTELGYRLSKRGLQIFYNCTAIAYHHQFFTFEDACRKKSGNAAAEGVFLSKEAGQQTLKENLARESQPGHALKQGIATILANALSPARRLLDSSVPLPWLVYQLFLSAATRQPKQPSSGR